jgi:hypothetical protein
MHGLDSKALALHMGVFSVQMPVLDALGMRKAERSFLACDGGKSVCGAGCILS